MKTSNQLLMDALTRHQVYLQRIAGQIRNGMNTMLDSTIDRLSWFLLKQKQLPKMSPLTVAYQKEIDKLTREMFKLRNVGYVKAEQYAMDQFAKLIENESQFVGTAINGAIGEELKYAAVPPTVLNNVLALGTYNGASVAKWFKDWQSGDLDRIVTSVRSGIAEGKTLDELVRAIVGTKKGGYADGVLQTTRNRAETLSRTITNGITNSARNEFYSRNSDIISGYRFSAVLDGRTSEICASLDGSVYKSLEDAPRPPLHPNCRSAIIPIVDGFGVVGNRPAVGGTNFNQAAKEEYINKRLNKGDDKTTANKKWNNLSNSAKNRMRNEQIAKFDKSIIGSVPAKTSYGEWLKDQPKSFQEDVLGKTKAELFRTGGKDRNGNTVTLSTFIDSNSNKPYTLAELRKYEPQLFKDDKSAK